MHSRATMQSIRMIILVLAGTLLLPVPAVATQWSGHDERLIAPAVVTQGEFALRLAHTLAIPIADDAGPEEAMQSLAALGIEPLDGWTAVDAPMTPNLVGELRHAVTNAAAAGRLQVEPAAALAAFTELIADLRLPLPYEQPPGYAEQPPRYSTYCDRMALDHYYGAVGPPYYTYCPPPPHYYYMYSWVPSRFYWSGIFFSGFFVLRDVHVVPRFKHVVPRFKHRPRHPRFSDGVIGKSRRDAHPPRAIPEGKGFRDIGRKPAVVAPRPHTPRVVPRGPDRPRFSEGILGGQRDGRATATRPLPRAGTSRSSPQWRQAAPSPHPQSGLNAGRARGPVAGAPPRSTPSPGASRGWRDVVPGRR